MYRILSLVLLAMAASSLPAREEPPAKGHLELMQAAASSLEAETDDAKFKAALALVSGADEPRLVGFEFLSLTETKFSLKHKTEQIRWNATDSALALKELPKAPKPAATAALRPAQMRQLVRWFTVKERLPANKNDTIECRLLAQPIDRYHSAADKIVDGAIFAFANGTNPEMSIVFETDGERWQYGTLRLSAAALSVALDGREVVAHDFDDGRGRTGGPYHNAYYRIARGR